MFQERLIFLIVVASAFCGMNYAQTATGNSQTANTVLSDALGEGNRLFRQSKFAEALAAFQQAAKENPKSGAAYEGIVRTNLRLHRISDAEAAAKLAMEQAPNISQSHTAMGEVLYRQGDLIRAQTEFATAYNMNASDARAMFGLSRVYRAASYHKHAYEALKTAHELDGNDSDITRHWIYTLKGKERIAAMEKYLADGTGLEKDDTEAAERTLSLWRAMEIEPTRKCVPVGEVKEATIPLELAMPTRAILRGTEVKLTINGKKLSLLLDTGAGGILLGHAGAQKAGLAPISAVKYAGIGDDGDRKGYFARADTIQIGDLKFENCLVGVTASRSVADVDGLIGADVFSKYLVKLDFPGRVIRLSQLSKRPQAVAEEKQQLQTTGEDEDQVYQDRYVAPEMQNFNEVFRFGHILLIPTNVGNSAPKLFAIDTGAWQSVVSPDSASEGLHGNFGPGARGLNGNVKKTYRVNKAVLQFGNMRQENHEIIAFDTSSISWAVGTEVSGLIGYTALGLLEVTIDYRDGLVNFSYDPKRATPIPQYRNY